MVYYIYWASKFTTSDHKVQQRRKNILMIARQPQSLVLMQFSSYLRLAVRQAHIIRYLNQFDFFSPKV